MKNNKKIIAANWKMNGSEELMKEFSQLTRSKHNDIIICPPFTLLDSAKTLLPNFIKIGAQNCSEEEKAPLQEKYQHQCCKRKQCHTF